MDSIKQYDEGRVFTGWLTLFGTLMAMTCLLCFLAITGFDLHQILNPDFALVLSKSDQALFRTSMIADCFGFYLPVLALGIYLWRKLRSVGGLLSDIAIMFLIISTMLGVSGAILQAAVLAPLSETYMTGDPMAKQAASAVWSAIAHGSQNGLWPMEGPTLGFWAIVNGLLLQQQGQRLGFALVLIGIIYILFAIFLFLGFTQIALILQLIVLPFQVIYLGLFGISLLRN